MTNILSIDVEEYFHANNIQQFCPIDTWDSLESRVEASTYKILESLEKKNAKATFFVLGYVANRHKQLVIDIAKAGHEIASHGNMHQLVYTQTSEEFYKDVLDAKKILEDIIGEEVKGYRAPSFSIKDSTPWAYDMLAKAGYSYDSSLYPVWHPRYSNTGKNPEPHIKETKFGSIKIYPLSTAMLFDKRLPIAGGAYWRLLPFPYIKWGMKQKRECSVYYFHPWEIDPEQPKYEQLGFLTKYRHYGKSNVFLKKIEDILDLFSFKSFKQYDQNS